MQNSIATDGFPGDMADWIFSALKSTQAKDDSSIYLGFKRIEDKTIITHDSFLKLIRPGNAAIILKMNFGEEHKPQTASMGHYTCAWIEDEEAQGYYHYDSLVGVSYSTCDQRLRCQFDWQKFEKNSHRVLYIFNLPLDPGQRHAAINGAVFNLTARLNGIIANALLLGDMNSNIFSYLS